MRMLSMAKAVCYGMILVSSLIELVYSRKPSARKLKSTDNIEVFVNLRSYTTGPIEDLYAVYTHDAIGAYVGPLNPDFARGNAKGAPGSVELRKVTGTFRAWAMIGINDDGYQTCTIQAIHDYGEYVFFRCRHPGVYRIYAWERAILNTVLDPPRITQRDEDQIPVLAWYSKESLKYFDLFFKKGEGDGAVEDIYPLEDSKKPSDYTPEMKHKLIRPMFLKRNKGRMEIALSESIHIESSTNCYYWMYRTQEIARAGYVGDTEVSPEVGTDGNSYMAIDLLIWIAEPSSVAIGEAALPLNKIKISEYSKMLTKRYFTLGLFPCLRKAHPAIEITKEIIFVLETDQDNLLQSPHWKASLKVHTDRLLTTLSDVSFTIAGRQNAALFGCFVGDTRVFISTKQFEFVPRAVLDRSSINLKLSKLRDVFRQKVKFQITQVFGHGVQYTGNTKENLYQPGTSRTDLVVIHNPCMNQEFAIAVGGSLYVAEAMIERGLHDTKKVYLPGLDDTTKPGKTYQGNRHYLRVSDVAFIPTHLVILLTGGFVILHPTSVRHKGLARMTNTEKHRPDQFVKRRWCGRTSTPKLSNMIVPAFSSQGSIIIIQVYPIEGSIHMWVNLPSHYCLPEGQGFIGKAEELRRKINETEIHYNEYVSVNRSDDRGIRIPTPMQRPEPPVEERDPDEELAYLVNNGTFIEHGGDPHYPPELANPASQVIGQNLENYNSAVIYVLNDIDADKNSVIQLLQQNELELTADSFDLQSMEFSTSEKQFIVGVKFNSKHLADAFKAVEADNTSSDSMPFQMLITTLTARNLPTVVKVPAEEGRGQDEVLDTLLPFPGTILIRSKTHEVPITQSRDPNENENSGQNLAGATSVEFRTQIFPVTTAVPAYVVNLGNVLIFTSLDGRYARPLYFFEFCQLDELLNPRTPFDDPGLCNSTYKKPKATLQEQTPQNSTGTKSDSNSNELDPIDLRQVHHLQFNASYNTFRRNSMYDVIVTAQGVISVMWRKPIRHLVQDDSTCLVTNETERTAVALGSVLINDGLRDIHGFYQNDNIFQMGTPEGEIVFGKYEVKPHSPFAECDGSFEDTASSPEICIQQPTEKLPGQEKLIKACTRDTVDEACRDPGLLRYCPPEGGIPSTDACLRLNNVSTSINDCTTPSDENSEEENRFVESDYYRPFAVMDEEEDEGDNETEVRTCYNDTTYGVTPCWPKHAPREELRSIKILGVSFYGYLHGSLKAVRSTHPEAPEPKEGEHIEEEPDVCPFVGFEVHNIDFDFAEVGYRTRVTGQISFLGKGIPTEADLLVEFQPTVGVVVEVTSSVQDQRDLTTVMKVIDVTFVLTDYQLEEIRSAEYDFSEEDFYGQRAREISSTFTLTFRPTIVNLYCRNIDYFKTVQFSVGCNSFSNIRLISEAAPFHRVNMTAQEKIVEAFKWKIEDNNLIVPKTHVYHLQVRNDVFNCSREGNSKCVIPHYELFKQNIFTTSYRDFFYPQFEQFLTVSTRRVTGNMIIYDLMGSNEFNITVNNLQAGCYSTGDFWYDELLNSTSYIEKGASEHEYIYKYYKDCFNDSDASKREQSQTLDSTPFYLFNLTNQNGIKFRRQRNQIFIFRAVVMNTEYNRFTYCKTLETFFLVRITGIPIPRQGLNLWIYILIIFVVIVFLIMSYIVFFHFYTWKLDSSNPMPEKNGNMNLGHDHDEAHHITK